MNLQNGYKVIYEKAADGKRTFYASKTGLFADAEVVTEAEIGKYKLIYEKAGRLYGSETGVPTGDDYYFTAFDKVTVMTEAADEGATDESDAVIEAEIADEDVEAEDIDSIEEDEDESPVEEDEE
jgi:hypothetical protein